MLGKVIKRCLITGVNGFVGSHLAEYLLRLEDTEVFGTVRSGSRLANLAGFRAKVQLVRCDLRDFPAVAQLIKQVSPHQIYHLAAQSSPAGSDSSPWETLENNQLAQFNLLEAVRIHAPCAKILVVGSGLEYGFAPDLEDPVAFTEEAPLRPASPYALSKVGQTLMGGMYYQNYGIPIVIARPFNHTGPRRDERFAESNFAVQIAKAEAGVCEPVISVGNLQSVRDFTDVRDVVEAYYLLLEHGRWGQIYNVCSGRGVKISEVLDLLLAQSSLRFTIEVEPGLGGRGGGTASVGDPSRLRQEVGWSARRELVDTLADLLDYWRTKVAGTLRERSGP